MPTISHDLTSTGLRVGTMVQMSNFHYEKRGIPIPKQRPALLLTKILSDDGANERAEVMWQRGHETGFLWVSPDGLEAYQTPA